MTAPGSGTFSNGSEYDAWATAWCRTCSNDDDGLGCPVIDRLLILGSSIELRRGPAWSPQTVVTCADYDPIPRRR